MQGGLQQTSRHLAALAGVLILALGCSTTQPITGVAGHNGVSRAASSDRKPGPDLYLAMAHVQVRKGDVRAAQAAYCKAMEIDRKCVAAYVGLGRLYDTQHDYPQAERIYLAGLKVDAKSAMLWNDLGLCYVHAGRFDGALRAFESATGFAPQNTMYENNLAAAYVQAGLPEEGLIHFGHTVGASNAHYNVGYLLHQQGLVAEAMPHLEKAIEINPQHSAASALLVQLQHPGLTSRTASTVTPAAHAGTDSAGSSAVHPASAQIPAFQSQPLPLGPYAASATAAESSVQAVTALPMTPLTAGAPASHPTDAAGHDVHSDDPTSTAPSAASADQR